MHAMAFGNKRSALIPVGKCMVLRRVGNSVAHHFAQRFNSGIRIKDRWAMNCPPYLPTISVKELIPVVESKIGGQ
jgi:hypothetical protein